jgi:eukaryotic-like serine/threonine-protein kinase
MLGRAPPPAPAVSDNLVPEPEPENWWEKTADQAATAAEVAPTEQLATIGFIGRSALKYQIGEGGSGSVYAAQDPLLSRLIAIKTLSIAIPTDESESFHALFLNEARAAGGLSHPNIVTVFDAGVSEQGPYIAMELLRGKDLRQLRDEGWRPTAYQAVLLVRRVADALAYAHSKGVVHRDIKPANIFMVGRTQPRVLDFGIARVAHRHDANAQDELTGGSPYYMAPEQIEQTSTDKRCDIFSLGVVLYELLTDSRPFKGSSLAEITDAVLTHQPPLAHVVDSSVPQALSDIVARAMQKNPDERFRSVRSFSRELRHWLEENPDYDAQQAASFSAGISKKWIWAAVGAMASVGVLGAGAWSLMQSSLTQDGMPSAVVAVRSAPIASGIVSRSIEPVTAGLAASALGEGASVASAPSAPSVPLVIAKSEAVRTSAAGTTLYPTIVPKKSPPLVPASAASRAEDRTTVSLAETAKVKELREKLAKAQKLKEARLAAIEERKEARKEARKETRVPAVEKIPVATGVVRLAVSPWSQVEVDGKAVGVSPPLNELSLGEGRHTITLRNEAFPPVTMNVNVTANQPVAIKHRFGS